MTKQPVRSTALMTIFILVAIMLGGMSTLFKPAPAKPATIASSDFSGERAYDVLTDILSEDIPHSAGTEANFRVRDRILARLDGLNMPYEIQKDFKCATPWPGCAYVENIISVMPGTAPRDKAVLITAHYDSVPASPGAGDDMSGVAAMLEIAANLQASGGVENDVIFLITDAEEAGLFGARAFYDSHPLKNRMGIYLGMESRGSSGPSIMFETGHDNKNQVAGFRAATERPMGTSLIVEIYKRMPNGTDYMVFKDAGMPGLNYAITNAVSRYHSSKDDLAHMDKGSIQHHGENLLAAVRYFGNMDLNEVVAVEDASYFDIFGQMVITWPLSIGKIMAVLALVFLIIGTLRMKGAGMRQVLWAIGTCVVAMAAVPALAWLMSFPLGQFGAISHLEHPNPWPARTALAFMGLVVAVLFAPFAARKAGAAAMFYVVWTLIAIPAVSLAFTIGGAAYIFLLPVLVAAAVFAFMSFANKDKAFEIAGIAGLVVGIYMALYHLLLLEVVMNFHMSHFKVPALWLMILPLMALLSASGITRETRKLGLGVSLIITLASTAYAYTVDLYTPTHPRAVNVVYRQMDTGDAFYEIQFMSPNDMSYAEAADMGTRKPFKLHGLIEREGFIKPAENLNLPAPTMVVESDTVAGDVRTITGTIQANRDHFIMGVMFDGDAPIVQMDVAEQAVLTENSRRKLVRIWGAGMEPRTFTLKVKAGAAIKGSLFTMGALPDVAGANAIVALRPDNAAPNYYGDNSNVAVSINF